jgi:hypothetical protein
MSEHFATLFDAGFLPQGLALYHSLRRHCPQVVLWVLSMDHDVERVISALDLPGLRVVPLKDVETKELLEVKSGRTRGEYCWTLTSWVFRMVFDRAPSASRVTYVDADVSILSDPTIPIEEMMRAGKGVLITPHAYAPEYDGYRRLSGTFCVQFLTVANTPQALAVADHWRGQCLAWCFNRTEPGRFGDQMYLETWPQEFPQVVHVVDQPWRFLAPWNVLHVLDREKRSGVFVTYHFHSARIGDAGLVRLQEGYRLGRGVAPIHRQYLSDLQVAVTWLRRAGFTPKSQYHPPRGWRFLLRAWKILVGRCQLAVLPGDNP